MFIFGRRRILIDVDTQKDFFLADGALCVRNHRRVLSNIRRISAWARSNNICSISTAQVYPAEKSRASYCIDGTAGQKKISYTLRWNRTGFPAGDGTDLPRDILRSHDQIIFHKRSIDPFEEPRLDRLLSEMRADEFIVIGAGTETAVKATVLGLLQRKKKVSIVVDAIGSYDNRRAEFALRQMKAKGAKLIEARALAGTSHLKLVGACRCHRCRGQMRKQPVAAGSEN